MASVAQELASWAAAFVPSQDDLALARRALVDTLSVALAAKDEPIVAVNAEEPPAARWAAIAHVLDFDDLHLDSTAHLSAVCVPAVLAAGGAERAYLAAAGVMARVGSALGWRHYTAGWHATCTSGALGASVGAGLALGLDEDQLTRAMALAVPAAGGVQRAFGSMAKALQVGFAAAAGVRAASLVAKGATADPAAVDSWLELMTAPDHRLVLGDDAVPGGLAIKLFPCCYALQRPIGAARELRRLAGSPIEPGAVRRITVRSPDSALQPLIHHRPRSGLQGKFSLEYGIAAGLLDEDPGIESFTDRAVARRTAQDLVAKVAVDSSPSPHGDGLLAGSTEVVLDLHGGTSIEARMSRPPGSPGRALTDAELEAKVRTCAPAHADEILSCTWERAAELLGERFPAR